MSTRYLVVIPAYNEEATIEEVVRLSRMYADVCVVNDASTDKTPQIIDGISGIHCIHHRKNTHIAGAILDGLDYALKAGYDYCFTIDAGMSHDPRAIVQFKERQTADLVIGYRRQSLNLPLYRKALSRSATLVMNCALRRRTSGGSRPFLKDVTSGFRMYSRRAVELLLRSPMRSRSFDFHLEALAHVYRSGMKIEEVPITYVFSNSSLRFKIVLEALHTWWRIWSGVGYVYDQRTTELS